MANLGYVSHRHLKTRGKFLSVVTIYEKRLYCDLINEVLFLLEYNNNIPSGWKLLYSKSMLI